MPRLAGMDVELHRAEFDKYTAPLLLLHGLWTDASMWRPAASFLAHRGWNAYALRWRGAGTTWSDLFERVQRAAAELGAPVVIGHDLGALLALHLGGTRAAVAISPLPCGAGAPPHPLALSVAARLARWRRAPFTPSRSASVRVLGTDATALVADASAWFDEITRAPAAPAHAGTPRLLVAGDADVCLPGAERDRMAEQFGAEIRSYAGAGHELPHGRHWQAVTADVHRWLVRRLGESLLVLRGDEDLIDE